MKTVIDDGFLHLSPTYNGLSPCIHSSHTNCACAVLAENATNERLNFLNSSPYKSKDKTDSEELTLICTSRMHRDEITAIHLLYWVVIWFPIALVNGFFQKSCTFSLQTLLDFEATKTGSGRCWIFGFDSCKISANGTSHLPITEIWKSVTALS